jgi:hypothetical protein
MLIHSASQVLTCEDLLLKIVGFLSPLDIFMLSSTTRLMRDFFDARYSTHNEELVRLHHSVGDYSSRGMCRRQQDLLEAVHTIIIDRTPSSRGWIVSQAIYELETGAKPLQRMLGDLALHIALHDSEETLLPLVECLLRTSWCVARGQNLHVLAYTGRLSTVELLLRYGASEKCCGSHGDHGAASLILDATSWQSLVKRGSAIDFFCRSPNPTITARNLDPILGIFFRTDDDRRRLGVSFMLRQITEDHPLRNLLMRCALRRCAEPPDWRSWALLMDAAFPFI